MDPLYAAVSLVPGCTKAPAHLHAQIRHLADDLPLLETTHCLDRFSFPHKHIVYQTKATPITILVFTNAYQTPILWPCPGNLFLLFPYRP